MGPGECGRESVLLVALVGVAQVAPTNRREHQEPKHSTGLVQGAIKPGQALRGQRNVNEDYFPGIPSTSRAQCNTVMPFPTPRIKDTLFGRHAVPCLEGWGLYPASQLPPAVGPTT